MRSTFLGFETQRTALNIAQKSLDITGANISNTKTEGYSRQRIDYVSITAENLGIRYSNKLAMRGMGCDATGVAQYRDASLDRRFREVTSEAAASGTVADVLTSVEDVFNEIDSEETGFMYSLLGFQDALHNLSSNNSDRMEMANIALNSAQTMVSIVQSYNTKLDTILELTKSDAESDTGRVNVILQQIADLNKTIQEGYISNRDITVENNEYQVNSSYGPLELKDQRNLLLDELSQYIDIRYGDNKNGTVWIETSGASDSVKILDDQKFSEFTLSEVYDQSRKDTSLSGTGADTPYKGAGQLVLTISDLEGRAYPIEAGIKTGSLKGYLDVYNGKGIYANEITVDLTATALVKTASLLPSFNSGTTAKISESDFNGIQYYKGVLNALAMTIHDEFNLATGFADRTTGMTVSATGTDRALFTGDSIETLEVSSSWKTNPLMIASLSALSANAAGDTLVDIGGAEYPQAAGIFEVTLPDGSKFFGAQDKSASPVTYTNIATNAVYNEDQIASFAPAADTDGDGNPDASGNYILTSAPTVGTELDNRNVAKLLSVFDKSVAFGEEPGKYTLEGYHVYFSGKLGSQIKYYENSYTSSETMLTSTFESRDGVMGVSLDEEGINLMNFQKWYNASARMVTVLDEALDTIINSMGLVGR